MSEQRVAVLFPPLTVAKDWIDYPYFADLGAVQLAAVLEARPGTSVTLVDAFALPNATLHWRRDGRAHLGASLDAWLSACEPAVSRADVVVVAVTPFHRPPHRDDVLGAALRGLRAMRDDVVVMLVDAYQSGQHYVEAATLLDAYPEADAWVKYEAEVTVPALLDALSSGVRPRGVHRGVAPPSLDALPLPAWHRVDLDAHDRFRARIVARSGRGAWQFPIDGRTLPMVTSRGCPFRCAHCSSNPGRMPGEPKTQRRHSAAAVRARVEAYVQRFGATRLAVLDELVNVNATHFDAFLDAVESVDVRFEVPNGFRADYLREKQLARLRGRVTTVSVSAESGAPRVLDTIVGKDLDLRDIVRVAEESHRLGVSTLIHFIIGLPGETRAEAEHTLSFALDLFERFGAQPAVQFATPLPGTRLADAGEGPRALPVVDDWGPRFQKAPAQPGALIGADELRRMLEAFERRVVPAPR